MASEQDKTTKVCLTCTKVVDSELDFCPDDGGELSMLAADPLIGTIFATKYEVMSLIGRGGMSSVYRVRHVLVEQVYALKVLHAHYTSNPTVLRRFQQEAKTIAALMHPNIVTLQDFGIDNDGKPFLVMEFLDGMTLSDLISTKGRMEVIELLNMGKQVLSGLSHAHKAGVTHRDLKPGNIVMVGSTPKIVDFGIAKIASEMGDQLTRTGDMFGSPLYMSPEQCMGQPLDARSDIYSLGCVLYECLTGKAPHKGNSTMETLNKHLTSPVEMIDRAAPDLVSPWQLEEAIFKALEKDPKRRFQSVDEFKAVLDGVDWSPESQKRVSNWRRALKRFFQPKPNPTVSDRLKQLAVVCSFYLVVGVGIIVFLPHSRDAFINLVDEFEWVYNDHSAHVAITQAKSATPQERQVLFERALKYQRGAKRKLGDRKQNIWRYYYYHRNMAQLYKDMNDPRLQQEVHELYLVMRELGFDDLATNPSSVLKPAGATSATGSAGATSAGATSSATSAASGTSAK